MSLTVGTSAVAERVASTISCAIEFAIKCRIKYNSRERCELLNVSFPDDFSKIKKDLCFGAGDAAINEAGELVRVYLNLNDPARFAIMRDAVHVALFPLLKGRRDIVVHDFEEGLKIILANNREIKHFHEQSPAGAEVGG
mgnify:CR=1 FL=1